MRIFTSAIGLLTTSLLTTPIAALALSPHPLIERVDAIAQHLVGQMETLPHPERPRVRMTTCVVQLPGLYQYYLYQEQALVNKLDQPYRQRVLLITPTDDPHNAGLPVESRAFRLQEQDRWAGLCDRPRSEREVVLNALDEQTCSVVIDRVDQTYVGKTPSAGCPTSYRGAVSISNTVILHETGMDTWDRGFDAQGNQVWGAEVDDPYQFRWLGNDDVLEEMPHSGGARSSS